MGGIVGGMLSGANDEESGTMMSGMAGSALAYAQQYFDVSQDDVIKRMRLAMTPYPIHQNDGGVNDFRARPDFWGPFWIATTSVLFLSATGNLARLLQIDEHDDFKADYGLVSFAAGMIYGCLIAVPLITHAVLYFSGFDSNSINVSQMICVYGYSLASLIPTSIVCVIPLNFIRWLAILAGLAASLAFMQGNLWADLSIEAPTLKWRMVAIVSIAQVSIFLIYRLHFF
jgi:hypothetical protein